MKGVHIFSFLSLLLVFLLGCSTHKMVAYQDSETKLIGEELDGSYTVRAWGRAIHTLDAYHQAQKQAIYDVIFNQIEAQTSNLRSLQPLLLEVNAEDKYTDYFDVFFADGGEYRKYCSSCGKLWSSNDFYKSDKQIVCKAIVCVDRASLRKRLIEDKILIIK